MQPAGNPYLVADAAAEHERTDNAPQHTAPLLVGAQRQEGACSGGEQGLWQQVSQWQLCLLRKVWSSDFAAPGGPALSRPSTRQA